MNELLYQKATPLSAVSLFVLPLEESVFRHFLGHHCKKEIVLNLLPSKTEVKFINKIINMTEK